MNKVNLFLDSGAFSAFTKGVTIDIQEYISFIKENQDVIETYANLDVIGDPVGTLDNQKIMEEAGLNPLPCFHYGEDLAYLKHYLSKYDYLALGGMVPISTNDLIPWLDTLFGDYICDKQGLPKIKIHGFGLTSLKLMLRYPWYCMTEEDHQVLTKVGWRNRNDLQIGDEILAFQDGISLWEPILEIPTFDVINTPIQQMDYRTFSARVTDNHRWRVMNRDNREWLWKTTDRLTPQHLIPRVGDYKAPIKESFSDAFVELFAWYWTEGSIKKRNLYNKPSIVIYQSLSANPTKVELIRDALNRSGEKFCETISTRKGKNAGAQEIAFELYGPVRDWLLELSPNKEIPMSFLLLLTKNQLELFIETSVLADGTKSRLIRKEGFTLCQKGGKNIDEFRIACLLAGIVTSKWNENEKGMIGIASSSVRDIYPYQIQKKEISYNGKLWCVRVPSGAFFTKCNDKIYVTGNSVDSTSWVMTGRMGSVLVPKFRQGRYNYMIDPFKVAVSDRSPSNKEAGKHFRTYSPLEQRVIQEYLNHKGYKIGHSEFRLEHKDYKPQESERWFGAARPDGLREVELIIEPGLANDYIQRDEINIIYFLDLEKALPKWPWAFCLKTDHAVKGGFGL